MTIKPFVISAAFLLVACATPVTVLKNEKTGETIECGGSRGGSIAMGAIGYHIQKDLDEDCVKEQISKGYKPQ
jgi:hypothetical protein